MHQFQTSVDFLDRLQRNFGDSWFRLNDIYVPLIRGWLRRHGVGHDDAEDIAQDVLVVVLRRLPDFAHRRVGSFRNWLRTITVNCLRDHRRHNWRHAPAHGGDQTLAALQQLESLNSELSRQWDAEHDRHVLAYAMNEAKASFSQSTWSAFQGVAVEGKRPSKVAAELGISENAVCIAKSRVSARMREVVKGLLA